MMRLRRYARGLIALIVIMALYGASRLPSLGDAARSAIVQRFGFEAAPLPVTATDRSRRVRAVHPSLRTHAGWISTVGAGVALADLDRDGLPNELVYVDVRTDELIVTPVPGTGPRFAPFTLEPDQPALSTWAPMGCLTVDLNEDGRLDVLAYYWGRSPVAFLVRAGRDGTSAADFAPVELVPSRPIWNTNAATAADVDGDGHVDLIIGNYFQDGARVLDPEGEGRVHMQDSMSRAFNGGVNRLLRWTAATSGSEPTITMYDVPGVFDAAVAGGWTLAVGAADLDGDLLPELYFANDFGPDRLLHNRSTAGRIELAVLGGRKTLNVPNSKVLGRDSFKGMGVDFGDVNGDGLLDMFVSNIADEYALQESHFLWTSTGEVEAMRDGVAPYVDSSEPLGVSRSSWGWDARLADFDNDGALEAVQATGFLKGAIDRWPELHELAMGNDTLVHFAESWPSFQPGDDLSGHAHNPFYVRQGGRYYDVAADLGLDQPWVTRGIATGDVDGDGRLDFVIANQWEDSISYRNTGAAGNAFLGLDLLRPVERKPLLVYPGPSAPPVAAGPAIGAQARVTMPDGRTMVGQVDGGNGHSGARSHQLHFGLGATDHATKVPVELRWRDCDGAVQATIVGLTPGWHTIVLGDTAEVSP